MKGIDSTHSWVRAKNSIDWLPHRLQYFFFYQVKSASHVRKSTETK